MKELKERILKDARVAADIIKVDSFLNHQMDIALFDAMGEEWHRRFESEGVTKILTIEASGIGIACIAARYFGVPVVFAKKTRSRAGEEFYSSKVVSFTHGGQYNVTVKKDYIAKDDKVLIIDDFLANGSALRALISITEEAGATVVGAGIAIEKSYLGGAESIRSAGYRIESLARIASIDGGNITFG